MTSYKPTKYNIFSTHALHIFVNDISSPTHTTLMFVLTMLYYVVFSSGTLSNLTMAMRAETYSWDIYTYLTI